MNVKRIASTLIILMSIASAAEADDRYGDRQRGRERNRERHHEENESRKFGTGAYVGGAFSIGIEDFNNVSSDDDYDEGFGFDIWVGSRIHKHVGVEGQLSYLQGFEIAGTGIDFNHLNGTVNLKLYPFDGKVQPYVLAGAGVGRFELEEPDGYSISDTGGVMRLGTGVDFYLNKNVALVAGVGYLFTAGDIADTDVVEMKFGVQYRF
jgi:opacity protein-like surface antigen